MAIKCCLSLLLWLAFELGCLSDAGIILKVSVNDASKDAVSDVAGLSIDNVGHSIYGGLYSQMLFGESFEESSGEGFTIAIVLTFCRRCLVSGSVACVRGHRGLHKHVSSTRVA